MAGRVRTAVCESEVHCTTYYATATSTWGSLPYTLSSCGRVVRGGQGVSPRGPAGSVRVPSLSLFLLPPYRFVRDKSRGICIFLLFLLFLEDSLSPLTCRVASSRGFGNIVLVALSPPHFAPISYTMGLSFFSLYILLLRRYRSLGLSFFDLVIILIFLSRRIYVGGSVVDTLYFVATTLVLGDSSFILRRMYPLTPGYPTLYLLG